jgi:hypothetical protein
MIKLFVNDGLGWDVEGIYNGVIFTTISTFAWRAK